MANGGEPKAGIRVYTRRRPRQGAYGKQATSNIPLGLNFTQSAPASVSKKGSLMRKGKAMGSATKVSTPKNPVSRGKGIKTGGSGKKSDNRSGGFPANAKTDVNIRGNRLARKSANVPARMVKKADKGASKRAVDISRIDRGSNRMSRRMGGLGTGGGLGSKGRQIKR